MWRCSLCQAVWCDGVRDCPAGQDEAQCLRLCGSSFLLQAYLSAIGSWRTVCSYGWADHHGKVSHYVTFSVIRYRATSCKVLPPDKPLSPDCGTRVVSNLSRVVGGQEVFHVCDGSIIIPYWIVMAAHCVVDRSCPEDWTVHAGFGNQISTHFSHGRSSVSHIVTHDYNTETGNNGIALIRLIKPLQINDQIRPVCLPNVRLDFTAPQTFWISGFGSTVSSGKSYFISLMEAEVSLIDRTISNSSSVYNGKITQDMKCAGRLEVGVDSCQGYSGGPLVTEKDSVWWLVGDTSWGDVCAQRNKPGVYGNVAFFLGWIYEQMQV
uniref:Transmembrane serine protease 2 n=1 Tax=Salmo trutta TaxID=8032 RepID=A0A674EWF1_SALTR